MSRAGPKLRDFAERLIDYEMRAATLSNVETAFLVSGKLRPSLATLMGNAGFHALLSRALALASAEVPWLRAVHVKVDGSFDGLHEPEAQRSPDEIVKGGAAVLAQLL